MRHSDARLGRQANRTAGRTVYRNAVIALVLLVVIVCIDYATEGGERLSLENVRRAALDLKDHVAAAYLTSVLLFIVGYIVLTLWLPAAAVLTLLAGFLFGTVQATLYVSAAALVAATLSFLLSRRLVGKWIQKKWNNPLRGFNANIDQFGSEYLILVRLIPMTPFLLVNVLAGMTKIRLTTYLWTTFVGILPGIILFTYVGRHLLDLRSLDDVMSWRVWIALGLMLCFVLAVLLWRYAMTKKRPWAGLGGKDQINVA